jgi:hypothetical protein
MVPPRGRAAEMQFIGEHREVPQKPHIHIANVSKSWSKNIVQSVRNL